MGGCEISHIKYSSVLGEAVAIAGTVISLMLCNKGRLSNDNSNSSGCLIGKTTNVKDDTTRGC